MAHLRLLSILFSMFLFASSCLGATSPKNIFILAGQSNMAGRGGVEKDPNTDKFVWDGIIPPESQPNPSILRLNPNYQWEEAKDPLHRGIDVGKTVGIGSGMPFANHLLEKAGSRAGVVGLVPYARGGTAIKQWLKNPGNPNAVFYNELVKRIKISDHEGGTVRALFWLQGETDAATNATALSYKQNLKRFITDLRNDVKPRFLPIVVVKIASYDTYIKHDDHNMDAVRQAEEEVHQELPDVQVIDALTLVNPNGEGYNKDLVHLSLKTEVALGQWLADTYLSQYGQLL